MDGRGHGNFWVGGVGVTKIIKKIDGIGKRLIYLRNQVGFDRVDMAETMNVSKHTYINYELERSIPDSYFLLTIKQKFNININWLIDGGGPVYFSEYS